MNKVSSIKNYRGGRELEIKLLGEGAHAMNFNCGGREHIRTFKIAHHKVVFC